MLIIPLNLDSVLLLLHNSKLAYYKLTISQRPIAILSQKKVEAISQRELC